MSGRLDASVQSLAEAILASPADAILATDRRGLIFFWNEGATRIFGFTSEEASGASLDLIIPERLRHRHWMGWAQAIAKGQTRYGAGDVLAVPAMTRDRGQISVEFTIVLIRDVDREIVGVAATLRDVTARFEEMRRLKKSLLAHTMPGSGEEGAASDVHDRS